MDVWIRKPEVAEESVRHVRVVVLPGVDEPGLAPGALPLQCLVEGRDLHEVWPRRGNQVDLEHGPGLWGLETAGVIPQNERIYNVFCSAGVAIIRPGPKKNTKRVPRTAAKN